MNLKGVGDRSLAGLEVVRVPIDLELFGIIRKKNMAVDHDPDLQ